MTSILCPGHIYCFNKSWVSKENCWRAHSLCQQIFNLSLSHTHIHKHTYTHILYAHVLVDVTCFTYQPLQPTVQPLNRSPLHTAATLTRCRLVNVCECVCALTLPSDRVIPNRQQLADNGVSVPLVVNERDKRSSDAKGKAKMGWLQGEGKNWPRVIKCPSDTCCLIRLLYKQSINNTAVIHPVISFVCPHLHVLKDESEHQTIL